MAGGTRRRKARLHRRRKIVNELRSPDDAELRSLLEPVLLRRLRKGELLTDGQLREISLKKGLAVTARRAGEVRRGVASLQRFGERRQARPRLYMAALNLRYGTLFVDVAFLPHKRKNDGHVGFVTAVCGVSRQLAAVPIKRKTIAAFEAAIETLLTETIFSDVVLLLSDRESSLFSGAFASWLRKKHGIAIKYLPHRNKSYLAEKRDQNTSPFKPGWGLRGLFICHLN